MRRTGPAEPTNTLGGAGPGRSEHWNVDTLFPIARQRESRACLHVPCERRTVPAEPPRGTDPQRQPRHSATAKQVIAPGGMRRSFRTLRLCAIPGVSPRAGMRCPVGALRAPHLPRAFLHLHEAAAGPGRSEHWNVDTLIPLARQRESRACPHVPCERRTVPAEPTPKSVPRVSSAALIPKESALHCRSMND